MHIVPMELPNRRFPTPPPFVHHPELFPDLAHRNPEPTNFEIPKKKGKTRVKRALRAAAVPEHEAKRTQVPTWMTAEVFKTHTEAYDWKQESFYEQDEGLRYELREKAIEYLKNNKAETPLLPPN